jgi:DNA-binding transcriptional MerR regulator
MQGLLHFANKPCTLASMSYPHPSTSLPAKALREYQKIANSDWGTGVPLTELLKRINRVAAHLAPEEDGRHSRVKRLYTDRSFRHYTTLGCIDPPEKEGRRSVYRFRHLVQALLVRKLLWERVPSEQIAVVMSGRGTEETERMFLGGIEMVARAGEDQHAQESPASGTVETWRRVQVVPGVELHVRDDLPKLGAAELKELMARLEELLRRGL